ncbi:hypothetical protein T08_2324 [Trichinella sp. T8]|nr:hypothetical protein T08_2324 [Trichinella sp. T8]
MYILLQRSLGRWYKRVTEYFVNSGRLELVNNFNCRLCATMAGRPKGRERRRCWCSSCQAACATVLPFNFLHGYLVSVYMS